MPKWSKQFKRFLGRRDARWTKLLERLEEQRGTPVLAAETELGDIKPWKEQLNKYFESYTKAAAKTLIDVCGERDLLDKRRQLTDRGHSLRAPHILAMRQKAYLPRTGAPTQELEAAIAGWEDEIALFESATREVMLEANKRMGLEDMCPDKLRSLLGAHVAERYPHFEDLRTGLADWLADEAARVAALQVTCSLCLAHLEDTASWDNEEWDEEYLSQCSHGQLVTYLMSPVKQNPKFNSKGKGKGT